MTLPDDSSISYTLAGTDLVRSTGTANRTLAKNITSVNFSVVKPLHYHGYYLVPRGEVGGQ